MTTKPTGYIADADVMIDFVKAVPHVIPLIARHLAPLMMPVGVLAEIDELNPKLCRKVRIQVYEPTVAELRAAANLMRPRSIQDRTCLHLSKTHGWTVITNDRQLRLCCEEAGVATLRGFGLLKQLVDVQVITATNAIKHAEAIHKANPLFITAEVVKEFRRSLG